MSPITSRREPRSPVTTRAIRGLTVAVIGVLCLVGCGSGDPGDGGERAVDPPRQTPTEATERSASTPTPRHEARGDEAPEADRTGLRLRRSTSLDLGRISQRLRSDGVALFLQQEPGRIVRIDPDTESAVVIASWTAAASDGLPSDLAIGGIGFLDRAVAASFSSTGSGRSRVLTFDPTTLAARDAIDAAPDTGPIAVGQGADSSLVGLIGAGALAGREADTFEPVFTAEPPTPLVEAAAVGGAVWALSPPASAVIGFSADGSVAHRIDLPAPTSIAISDGSLWVGSAATGAVAEIDPGDGTVETTIRLPGELVTQAFVRVGAEMVTATSLVAPVDGDPYWQLSLIDPTAAEVIDTVVLGSDPDLAPASSFLGERLYVIEDGTTLVGFDLIAEPTTENADSTTGPTDLELGPSSDERALLTMVERALDYRMPVDVGLLSDGTGLDRVAQQTVEAARDAGRERGVVRGTSVVEDTALVSFDVVDAAGATVVRGALLTARRVDGSWRLDTDWFCGAAAELGVSCP